MNELPEYSGWKNYPTWSVNLWLTDEEALYCSVRGMNAVELRDFVETLVENSVPGGTMATDLIGWALEYIDWREITEHINEE